MVLDYPINPEHHYYGSELQASTQIDCSQKPAYTDYSRCQLRDDIEWRLQALLCVLFVVNLAIFIKALSNLIVINRISRRTRSLNMKRINIVICLFACFEICVCLDGPLQLIFGVSIPLNLYRLAQYLGAISINTVLCLGGYFWIVTVFTAMLYNKHTKSLNYAYFTLLGSNLVFAIFFIISYSSLGLHDNQKMTDASKIVYSLSSIFTAFSTALNGIFFAIGCLMLRGYLKKNWQQNQNDEGMLLSRFALVGLFIALLRVLQNILNFCNVSEMVKESSVLNQNWWWAIYVTVYLTCVNVLPALFFLKKFEPNPSQKVNEIIKSFENEGTSVKVIKLSDTDAFERDAHESLLVSTVFLREQIEEPLSRSVANRQ